MSSIVEKVADRLQEYEKKLTEIQGRMLAVKTELDNINSNPKYNRIRKLELSLRLKGRASALLKEADEVVTQVNNFKQAIEKVLEETGI